MCLSEMHKTGYYEVELIREETLGWICLCREVLLLES